MVRAVTNVPGIYEQGATATFALASDPRFSFCLFVPARRVASSLLVVVHGSYRSFQEHRDQFAGFAEAEDCVVLAPLFPAGVRGDGNVDGYKYLLEGDIRYDLTLLAMVDQVAARFALDAHRFGVVGFSGGAHFSHRLLILHPSRLWGVSVGAPGSVTLLDDELGWWPGIRDAEVLFGITPDFGEMAKVPVQLVVGENDLDTTGIEHDPGSPNWLPGADRAGANRPDRLRALHHSLAARGVSAEFEIVANVGHEAWPIFEASKPFLARSLSTFRARGKKP